MNPAALLLRFYSHFLLHDFLQQQLRLHLNYAPFAPSLQLITRSAIHLKWQQPAQRIRPVAHTHSWPLSQPTSAVYTGVEIFARSAGGSKGRALPVSAHEHPGPHPSAQRADSVPRKWRSHKFQPAACVMRPLEQRRERCWPARSREMRLLHASAGAEPSCNFWCCWSLPFVRPHVRLPWLRFARQRAERSSCAPSSSFSRSPADRCQTARRSAQSSTPCTPAPSGSPKPRCQVTLIHLVFLQFLEFPLHAHPLKKTSWCCSSHKSMSSIWLQHETTLLQSRLRLEDRCKHLPAKRLFGGSCKLLCFSSFRRWLIVTFRSVSLQLRLSNTSQNVNQRSDLNSDPTKRSQPHFSVESFQINACFWQKYALKSLLLSDSKCIKNS